MGKRLLIVVAGIVVLGVALVVVLLLRFKGQPLPASIEEVRCTMPVTVQGGVMEPAIKAGTALLFDKCTDRQNAPAGTIVLFAENDSMIVGRVTERTATQGAVTYTITQDARPEREFVVAADQIIATGR